MGIDETLAHVRAELCRLDPVAAAAAAHEPATYLVDIRPESLRRGTGELPGAIVIERNHLEWRLDPGSDARIPEAADRDVRWIIVCQSGFSSSLAAHSLRQIGLVHTADLIGGFDAWLAAGLPVDHPTEPDRPRGPGEGPTARSPSNRRSPGGP
ncbi:rhodanese-like domain-containing protein [Kribbella sp. NPDC026596]|uniref:rhodanese-like domain-containing protein n=1 Tax=Kribbella sp. NPDC026596 TaxID=3155122 RepID=UPI00340BEAA6